MGVHNGCAEGVPAPPPCTSTITVPSARSSRRTRTATTATAPGPTTTATAGFAFHFTLLDTEEDYDYVYVKDATGAMLATYTGHRAAGLLRSRASRRTTGSVHLVSDPGVTGQGFIVDAVESLLT